MLQTLNGVSFVAIAALVVKTTELGRMVAR